MPADQLLYERRNGKFVLQVTGHPDYGVPFGQDRIVPIFLATLAVQQKSQTMGAAHIWRSAMNAGAHHEGGTRMGSDPRMSVVNRYSQSWDIPNLFIVGSSTFPSMSGFNPTLTIQALAYMTADAIVKRYKSKPGPLV